MKYLFVGDTHGDMDGTVKAIRYAAARGIDTIIQVGDWGFCWPGRDQASKLREQLQIAGVRMLFIDGNHDEHPKLRSGRIDFQSLRYMPRGSTFTDVDGTTFLFVGGAPSIDHAHRVEGASWWPEEVITERDVEAALSYSGRVDVMVCHDSPIIPDGFSDNVGTEWFRTAGPVSRASLARIARHHRPRLIVHGHWHKRYTRIWEGMRVEGLDASHGYLGQFLMEYPPTPTQIATYPVG